MSKLSFAAVALVAAVSCPGAASAQGTVGTLTGVITDAAGSAVAGAFVQMRNAERRLNFMVITQEQGKYSIDRLPAGKYVVQAIGGEYQSAPSSPVEVAAGKASSIDLSLTVERAPALPPAWPGRSPGERGAEAEAAVGGGGPRLAEGEGKAIIEAKCMTCHDAQRIVRSRANEARWQQVLSTMTLYAQGSTLAKPLSGDEAKGSAGLPLDQLCGRSGQREAEARSVQPSPTYAPSAGGRGATWWSNTNCPTPGPSPTKLRSTVKATAGSRSASAESWVGSIMRRSPTLNTSRQPAARRSSASTGSGAAITASCGWSTAAPTGAGLASIRSTSGSPPIACQPTRSGNATGNTMRVHPDNTVWLAAIASNQIIRLDPATQEFTIYDVPVGVKNNKNATPYGMAVGGDGNIWVVENAFDQIARVDRTTGKIDEFPLGVKDPVARKLGADWDGNLWVGLHGAGELLRVDYKTLKMTEFTPPSKDAGVYLAEPDLKNHLIWTTLHQVDKLARLDPATGVWTEYPLMHAETDVRRIDLDPTNPKRVWYSGVLSSRMGYIELLQ